MVAGKQASDYRVENIEKRDKCPTCNGTGWVDKPKPELSSEYPKRIKHPLGHDVVVNSAEEEAAHLAHPAKDEDDAPAPLAVPDAPPVPVDNSRATPLPLSAPYPVTAEEPKEAFTGNNFIGGSTPFVFAPTESSVFIAPPHPLDEPLAPAPSPVEPPPAPEAPAPAPTETEAK